MDEATDRLHTIVTTHQNCKNTMDEHSELLEQLRVLDAIKPTNERGRLLIWKKKKKLLKRMRQCLDFVAQGIKENPLGGRREHVEDLKSAIREDIFSMGVKADNFDRVEKGILERHRREQEQEKAKAEA